MERRRSRGLEVNVGVASLESSNPVFGTFETCSASGERYCVEIRSLQDHVNSCDCANYQINGLGTCKHVEAILYGLKTARRDDGAAAARGNPRTEVFLDRRDGSVRVHVAGRGYRQHDLWNVLMLQAWIEEQRAPSPVAAGSAVST